MGVKGLTQLLTEEGWLPQSTSCGKATRSVWRIDDCGLDDRLECIPKGSTMVIDGNGLAFHLHSIAYARHFDSITAPFSSINNNTRSKRDSTCICWTKSLTNHQATALLPNCLPLHLLEAITEEFVKELQRNDMTLQVFWDGNLRRLKSKTSGQRRAERDSQWTVLKKYCQYGVIPFSNNKSHCYRDWLRSFPYSTLFLDQIRHSLRKCKVEMIACEEEADADLARRSAKDPFTYILGSDSDFCCFTGSKYIPLNTLDSSGAIVTAVVVTRSNLADHFDFPDEHAMIELALLMGNDYVNIPEDQYLVTMDTSPPTSSMEKLEHIRESGPGYRVSCSLPDVEKALHFSRAFYGLEDISDYPFDDDEEVDVNKDGRNKIRHDSRPSLPSELNLSLTALVPLDLSLREVVLRPLEAYLEMVGEHENDQGFCPVISWEHVDAFQQAIEHEQAILNVEVFARPCWDDVVAAYIIEKCISWVRRSNPNAPAVRLSSPSKLFDQFRFHSLLKTYRIQNGLTDESSAGNQDATTNMDTTAEINPQLPIDEHKEIILRTVQSQRVTIIHGETGCGKSSRVPVMLLRAPPSDPSFSSVKLFISQPRRIAAKSLVERLRSCEPDLRDAVALRMGHGVREYETSRTRAWFVTTGYLVRLLANHPEKFDDCSHLIIDEVHERSVDTDILCLLCRRLLKSNPRIRLILMSATLAASLYQQYFGVPEEPIHVGSKRFQIQEFFVEDLTNVFSLQPKEERSALAIQTECDNSRCQSAPSNGSMVHRYILAAHLTMAIGRPGSSILIFVPGMNDIISITDLLEKLYIPGIKYTFFPIHSDIPFDEQLAAFDSPAADEVKVVIATNAAESSVTIPDVDHVICLGLCKQIVYNRASHRQMLQSCWISKASSVQRAGRTGRVRQGSVYRLYTKKTMELYMEEFEPGEMVRIPLDSVILSLKEMLKEEATPVLLQCLEPPDLSTIDRSFQSLYASRFISEPDDSGKITSLGSFVTILGIDLTLGSLIGLGIQFGIAAEALEMATVLAFPKSLWIMTSPLYHEAAKYNDITIRTFMSRCHFDSLLYSEPLADMNLVWDYEHTTSSKNSWCWNYSASAPRLRQLATTKNNLRSRVADFLGIDAELLLMKEPPVRMHHAKLTILRILQVWVFPDSIIEGPSRHKTSPDSVTLALTGTPVEEWHLEQVLDKERHPFTLLSHRKVVQSGTFTPVGDEAHSFNIDAFLIDFENHFLSFALENGFKMFSYQTDDLLQVFVPREVSDSKEFAVLRHEVLGAFEGMQYLTFERATLSTNGRGRKGRPCGLWSIQMEEMNTDAMKICVVKWSTPTKKKKSHLLKRIASDVPSVNKVLSCIVEKYSTPKKNGYSPSFTLSSHGNCSIISNRDMMDIFSTPQLNVRVRQPSHYPQSVVFQKIPTSPLPDSNTNDGSNESTSDVFENSSWHRPLVDDIPEGARLLSVLASGRRRDHMIRLSSRPSFENEEENNTNQPTDNDLDDTLVDVSLSRPQTKISQRWRRLGSDYAVFTNENSVPAAAVPMRGPSKLYACCSNTLELKGGAVRVEGVTLLPGRLFLLLSFLTFGINPSTNKLSFDGEEGTDNQFFSDCLCWLYENDVRETEEEEKFKVLMQLKRARDFHKSCQVLGEQLVCKIEKVCVLCQIFDAVDGYSIGPWDDLDENPMTAVNLAKWQRIKQSSQYRGRGARKQQDEGAKTIKEFQHTKYTSIMRSTENNRMMEVKSTVNSASTESIPEASSIFTLRRPEGERVAKSMLLTTAFDTKEHQEIYNIKANKDLQKIHHTQKSKTIEGTQSVQSKYPIRPMTMKSMPELCNLLDLRLLQNECAAKSELPTTHLVSLLLQLRGKKMLQGAIPLQRKILIDHQSRLFLGEEHWHIYSIQDHDGKDWFYAQFVNTFIESSSLQHRSTDLPSWMISGHMRPTCATDALKCVPNNIRSIPILEAKVTLSGKEQAVVLFRSIDMALKMESAFWLELHFRKAHKSWYQQRYEALCQMVCQHAS